MKVKIKAGFEFDTNKLYEVIGISATQSPCFVAIIDDSGQRDWIGEYMVEKFVGGN